MPVLELRHYVLYCIHSGAVDDAAAAASVSALASVSVAAAAAASVAATVLSAFWVKMPFSQFCMNQSTSLSDFSFSFAPISAERVCACLCVCK